MRTSSPSTLSIGTAIGLAVTFTRSTAMRWLPVALVTVLVGALLSMLFTQLIGDVPAAGQMDREQVRALLSSLQERAPSLAGLFVLSFVASLALAWIVTALAIDSLRGRNREPLTFSRIFDPGIRSIGAGVLIVLGSIAAIAAVALIAVLLYGISESLAVIWVILAFAAAAYIWVRLMFVTYAIFDGAGVREGIYISWRVSRDAFWRIIGWVVLILLLSLFAGLLIGIPVSFLPQPVVDVITTLGQAVITVFTTAVFGLLYESQRAKHTLFTPPPDDPEITSF